MNIEQQIEALSVKIAELAKQQSGLSRQIISLMDELEKLKRGAAGTTPLQPTPVQPPAVVEVKEVITPPKQTPAPNIQQPKNPTPRRSTLEEFIGGNLASKAGILITIIGIFIGAKYAIENNLVNPAVRVISGYVSGLVLIGVALRLRKKYEQYSSVLMGGGLAVLYFITYIAYSFYNMLPQTAAFGLMLLFTAGTVYAALLYNRSIIAHLGLVGAYAIPILLSDNSGRYAVLFTYIAIINAGILVLSFRKYWKSLFYVSYALTWMIFSFWMLVSYREQVHFNIAFTFLGVFFLIFYATFLAYKLIKKEQYTISDVIVLLSNAFIFYGFGYGLLSGRDDTAHLLGAFTLANAVIHLAVSLVIRKLKLADKALFYLLLGLVIAFVTIAVPVQLNGNWVTLLWTAEAALVFFIGRTQHRTSYEKLGAVLVLLSFLSLLEDWSEYLDVFGIRDSRYTPVFNIVFVTGLLVALAQGAMIYLHRKRKSTEITNALYLQFYDYALPALFLLTSYFVFELEIYLYFKEPLRSAVILLYTMVFVTLASYINQRWINNKTLGTASVLAAVISILVFLFEGPNTFLLRYYIIAATAVLLVLGNRSVKLYTHGQLVATMYAVFIQVTILSIISFEYLKWMNEYKLGLSILWSIYALGLVIAGINKKKRHWRLTGICFFIITVIKLFMYDLNQTTTISKTISFISLGAILLLVSYLYNRYKEVILAEDEQAQ